jgi:hypothetical protein
MLTVDIKKSGSGEAATALIKELARIEVLIGVPEEAGRKSGEMTNAALMYIHSNGSPRNNIPARPVIEPAIEDDMEALGVILGDAIKAALNGDKTGRQNALEKAGLRGQNDARNWFTNPKNGWDSLKDGTIAARSRKMTKQTKEKQAARIEAADGDTKVAFKPLLDSGQLQDSITYAIREK